MPGIRSDCSARFKDAVQLRNRIKRRGMNTARAHDVVTDEGLFIKGVIEGGDVDSIYAQLIEKFELPNELIWIDREKDRIEVAAWILEPLAGSIEARCAIIEEYPTADRLEVERRPL